MDTASLIIAICVAVPALITISVCGIIFYSHRSENRKFHRQTSLPDVYHHSYERRSRDNHIIDISRPYHYQQQRRLREPSIVSQQPPSYNSCFINQTRRQQLSLFSPIYTTPLRTNVYQASHVITPSKYATMPPSYAEIFLTPHRLTNR